MPDKGPAAKLLQWLPKDLIGNAKARKHLWNVSKAEQGALLAVCGDGADGLVFWLNAFGWTYDPRTPTKHLPFITWPKQDEYLRQLHAAIYEGHDILSDKSRDEGASWLCCMAFLGFWLFVPDTPLLMVSRKEDYVDQRGNPDCLFWKLDYALSHLPPWMRPKAERRLMQLANLDNGSVINGESTNQDVGKGGRRKAILLDEFAAVDNGDEILAATADTTPCRMFNSTPKGMGNAFARVRFSGKVKVITLAWWQDPRKNAGLRTITLPDGKKKFTAPWYEAECARRTSRKEIAQELDIDYLASGEAFFDLPVCQRMRGSGQLRDPDLRGEVGFKVDTRTEGVRYRLEGIEWKPGGGRHLSLWLPLIPDSKQKPRPRQDRNYVAFADISNGQGASNSVLKIADTTTREEVAALVDADLMPQDFARACAAVCMWFGGQNNVPLLGWEANGPGQMFGKELYRLGYRLVLGNTDPNIPWEPSDNKIGWWSSRDKKEAMLGDLRGALAREELILHDERTVTELEQYITYPSGAVGPSAFIEEAEGARKAHGDRVIGTGGLLMCLRDMPKAKPADFRAPPKSYAFRMAERTRRRNARKKGW